jgi:hypothetical protein
MHRQADENCLADQILQFKSGTAAALDGPSNVPAPATSSSARLVKGFFEAKYGLDLGGLAKEFARKSPALVRTQFG